MSVSNTEIVTLLEKFLNNRLTPPELAHFRLLANKPDNHEVLARAIETLLKQNNYNEHSGFNEEEIFQNILSESEIIRSEDPTILPMARPVHFLRLAWLRYAAAILLIAGTAAFLYLRKEQGKTTFTHIKENADILPGGNKAILTLADGSTIVLDNAANGSLAQQGNTNIVKLDAGSLTYNAGISTGELLYNTITTPRGGQYQVTLPDGSKVWLNAASSISFPIAFAKERTVKITGEVYLEIAQNKNKPFIVSANNVQVQVLGTSFNLNAYPDEEMIKTTLLEGSIRVSANKYMHTLTPGQQVQVNVKSSLVTVNNADTEKVMAWKNGLFNFKDADLPTVMRQLERWYDIRVKYTGEVPVFKFQGELERGLNLSQVLKILSDAEVKLRLEGRSLIIMP